MSQPDWRCDRERNVTQPQEDVAHLPWNGVRKKTPKSAITLIRLMEAVHGEANTAP